MRKHFLLLAVGLCAASAAMASPKSNREQKEAEQARREATAKAKPAQAPKPAEKAAPPAPLPAATEAAASESFSHGQLGFELLGPGLLYSFNGSARYFRNFALNAAVSHYGISQVGVTFIPLSLSALLGSKDHYFEINGGAVLISASAELRGDGFNNRVTRTSAIGQAGLGYRFWPDAGGVHIRAMLNILTASGAVLPWPGFSIGYAF